jgi:hypothetical protein
MEAAELFRSLSPLVQLALVRGDFVTLLLLACNRAAGTNLIAFFLDVLTLYEQRHRRHTYQISRQPPPTRPKQGENKRSYRGSSNKWTGINGKIEKQPVEAIHEDELSAYTMLESFFSPSVFIELKQPVEPVENT